MALILASGSPRRRELMSLITPEYTVITSELDETKIAADSPAHLAKALATAKARAVAEEMKARYGVKEVYINYIGPVIGSHTGPNTMGIFFVGTKR